MVRPRADKATAPSISNPFQCPGKMESKGIDCQRSQCHGGELGSATSFATILERMVFPHMFSENGAILSDQAETTRSGSLAVQNAAAPRDEPSCTLRRAQKCGSDCLDQMGGSFTDRFRTDGTSRETPSTSSASHEPPNMGEESTVLPQNRSARR